MVVTNTVAAKSRMPDAFIILFFVVLLAAIATHLIPAGQFSTQVNDVTGKTQLVADSYRVVNEYTGVPLFAEGGNVGFLNFAFEGMVSGSKWGSAIGVMMFIILTGGAFGIVMQTGAINNGVISLVAKTKNFEQAFLPILFVLFSLGGAVFGMGEEAIAFCIVLLPLMFALGYDSITTVLVTYIATQIGFAASWMNPFSVAIAQGIAEVPLLSGMEYRMLMWVVFTLAGTWFTVRYAKKIKAAPEQGANYAIDKSYHASPDEVASSSQFNKVDGFILSAFCAGIIWVIYGVIARGYYIPELASQFFTLGVIIGIIAILGKRLAMNDVADAFQQGAKDLLPAAMIVGMAKGIVIVLGGDQADQPSVLNTILYYASQGIGQLSETFSALLMFVFQSIFNFFIASGSGQAALTMPLMAPLSDLVGVSRQIAVLAFQLGDGLTNLIIPTSASLIGCLGVARVEWLVWAKFIYRFLLLLMAIAMAFIVIAVQINFS
ncbi:putative basic amino acid antiporter YfcC [Thalassotalea mangrovi]|uniref:Putative basic amino acid antiporter YfcC n=1 Tax=Thalassotalea mangrovi TaxID=2572245 RepID=A0A4U1B9U2_9GAMM|nr:putative basic amino acid antiporter YfcC [Thalassotalea mangrovi]TKB47491.1 putative basic amino acid antiporter YfcC [Thalassotalea mangrovi]